MHKYNINDISIGKNAILLSSSKIATTFIALISSMLLSRILTITEYGTYSQMLMIINLTLTLLTMGLPNSTSYFLARADSMYERGRFLSVYLTAITLLSIMVGILLYCILPLIAMYFKNSQISLFRYFFTIYPWTLVTIASISNILIAYNKMRKLLAISIVHSCVLLIPILVTKVAKLSFENYIFLLLLSQISISIWIYVIIASLAKSYMPILKFVMLKKILHYSLPIGLASIIGLLTIEIDKLMIGRLMDTDHLAIYANAGRELPVTIIASSLAAVLLPQVVHFLKRDDYMHPIYLWKASIHLSYIIICFIVTFCFVFATQIMTFLYSEKYIAGVDVFRIYSLTLLLRITYFGLILNAIGRTIYILLISVFALIFNMLLNYVFFIIFGFIGPALATFITIFFTQLVQLYASSNILKIPLTQIFPWKDIIKISALNIFLGVSAYAIAYFFNIGTDNKSIVLSVLICILFLFIYIIIVRKKTICLWKILNTSAST